MVQQLAQIFFSVIAPVFGLVLIGFVAGPRLQLDARTLSRVAYFLFVPAYVFHVVSTAVLDVSLLTRMIAYTTAVHMAIAVAAYLMARGLRRPRVMVGAYIIIAVFGNVGNFGLPLIEFRLGPDAVLYATFYFLIIVVLAFIISVTAAGWAKGGGRGAALGVFKTPALLALFPALLFNGLDITPPLFLSRIVGLLAAAMVPTMLLTLGVQLAGASQIRFNRDVVLASGLRLIGAAALAYLLAGLFGLTGLVRAAGVLQASMPTAVLAAIIALEHDLLPDFVTTAVLFTTLASVITLPFIMLII
ncbi:MAG TPA: AEC family transporter [Chloroflexota bacterium]|nr:AEC family transporter [Chloroflexota bacterium]HUM68776.1 AEC family transporter [Chloroflexota bacterium]